MTFIFVLSKEISVKLQTFAQFLTKLIELVFPPN